MIRDSRQYPVHYKERGWWYTRSGSGRGGEIAGRWQRCQESDGLQFICFCDFCLYSCGCTYKQERRWKAKISLRGRVLSFPLQVKNEFLRFYCDWWNSLALARTELRKCATNENGWGWGIIQRERRVRPQRRLFSMPDCLGFALWPGYAERSSRKFCLGPVAFAYSASHLFQLTVQSWFC